mmetsp:Transcript_138167/g.240248  ORF Transcript_138167/g.240248 Transcript_138167/m.240248 type:complete len:206 (-) Transcript_138167:1181-1798(-)
MPGRGLEAALAWMPAILIGVLVVVAQLVVRFLLQLHCPPGLSMGPRAGPGCLLGVAAVPGPSTGVHPWVIVLLFVLLHQLLIHHGILGHPRPHSHLLTVPALGRSASTAAHTRRLVLAGEPGLFLLLLLGVCCTGERLLAPRHHGGHEALAPSLLAGGIDVVVIEAILKGCILARWGEAGIPGLLAGRVAVILVVLALIQRFGLT